LSYDISKVNELQYFELQELLFVSQLFKSELELEVIQKLLLKLPKPYSYDYNTIYFNIFLNSWEYLPKEIDEEEIIENYIDNLTAEDDEEKIKEMINTLQELLR
jgi:hypothetical protein